MSILEPAFASSVDFAPEVGVGLVGAPLMAHTEREGLLGLASATSSFAPATSLIMIVDGEGGAIRSVQRYLVEAGFQQFLSTTHPHRAMQMIREHEPDVLLLDMVMPGVNGLEILEQLRSLPQLDRIPVILMTTGHNRHMLTEALSLGVTDFLVKPIDALELVPRVRNALLLKARHDRLLGQAAELERQVTERTAELARSRLEVIHCLGRAAEYRDNETGRHVVRVGHYAGIIARQLHLDPAFVELIELAAPLHDMGKLGIPDAILLKPGKLDTDEMAIMRQHCQLGERTLEPQQPEDWYTYTNHTSLGVQLLQAGSSPVLHMAAEIALTHHEKWDGTGYPAKLRGEVIPISGR